MGLQYQFRPIEQWPGQRTSFRTASKFRAGWSDTIDLLERELTKLGAKNIVIQADVGPGDIRLDGMLRADARPRTPAVILSFDSKYGPLSYPCDRYPHYQDNVRAIALSLEALRSVDRYGVTRRAEQYKGWEKLPPPASNSFASKDAALQWLMDFLGITLIPTNRASMESALSLAIRRSHPDMGGNAEDFKKVQSAKDLLLA